MESVSHSGQKLADSNYIILNLRENIENLQIYISFPFHFFDVFSTPVNFLIWNLAKFILQKGLCCRQKFQKKNEIEFEMPSKFFSSVFDVPNMFSRKFYHIKSCQCSPHLLWLHRKSRQSLEMRQKRRYDKQNRDESIVARVATQWLRYQIGKINEALNQIYVVVHLICHTDEAEQSVNRERLRYAKTSAPNVSSDKLDFNLSSDQIWIDVHFFVHRFAQIINFLWQFDTTTSTTATAAAPAVAIKSRLTIIADQTFHMRLM